MSPLEKGMVFASSNPQGIGKPIRWAERFWAKDKQAEYGHTGIITGSNGETFEALGTIKESDLFKGYAGKKVMIVRPLTKESVDGVQEAIWALKIKHLGQVYPGWRLLLFLVPPLARRISYRGKWVVCSELTAKFLWMIGVRHGGYAGTNPDDLVDEWRMGRDYEIVFEGLLPGTPGELSELCRNTATGSAV